MGETTRPRLCLGDVLAEESFGLTLVSGGPDCAQLEVVGAHAVEVDEPARWLAREWVMLTTGVRLRGNAQAQRALVPALEDAGVTALGFGVGLGFKHVPAALVEVAHERGFPVFAVPYDTPFREIVHFVERSLTGADEHVFRRLTALQRYLVDALRTPEPERAMVDRLAGFLDAGVMLLGADGEPEIVAGKPPVAALRSEIDSQPVGLMELEAGGWHAVATPIVTRLGHGARWLVLASPRPGHAPFLVCPTGGGEIVRPATIVVNKSTIADERLGRITWGAAQLGVAQGVLDALADGTLAVEEAGELVLLVALWVDPAAGLACAFLCDRDFGPWAVQRWPDFSDAILEEFA